MGNLMQDLKYGLRGLRKSPGFAAAAVIVLPLGIGANTAIFSVVNAVLLRPLPLPEPDRLMLVWHVPPAKSFPGVTRFSVSPANYLDWQNHSHVFEKMAALSRPSMNLTGGSQPESLTAGSATADFFSVMKTAPILGRVFGADEDQPGHDKVVLLSTAFWKSHFGSNSNALGQKLTLDGDAYTVIGVMPPTFDFPPNAQIWVPLVWTDKDRAVRGDHNYIVVARLMPGVNLTQAQAEMDTISGRLQQQYPADNAGWGAVVVPLSEQLVGDVRPALLVLLGAVAFVLLIACANVANLVLGKILARKKEIAIRTALGATRFAILRQILAETVLLSLAAGALGLFLARFGTTSIVNFLADRLPRFTQITLDAPVLAFTAFLALFAGIIAGLLPALRFTKTDVNEALKQGQSRGSSDSGGSKTRGLLVVCEVALSLVLLIGAGLMVRTLWQLSNIQPGFDPNGVLTMNISVPANKFTTPNAQIAFFERVLQRVRATHGVESAGVIDDLPM